MSDEQGFWRSRRARLLVVLLAASFGVTVLALSAADHTMSYYVTPEEFARQIDTSGSRWRVGGRVVEGSVAEEAGRPARFTIEGEHGERMAINYPAGPVPSLFGAGAFVIVEGESDGPDTLRASSVIIKHEDEFVTQDGAAAKR